MKLTLILALICWVKAKSVWEGIPCDTCLGDGKIQCLRTDEWFGAAGGSCCAIGFRDNYCIYQQKSYKNL